jgi:beta-lactamase regulating signal transducer with metallopeptidase domain
MTETLLLLARLNLAATAAIVLVLLLRPLVRRRLRAQITYALWLAVPLAGAWALTRPAALLDPAGVRAEAWLSAHGRALAMAWAAGVVASVLLVAIRYARFQALARQGRAGPAIVGVLAPRLVLPADFPLRFTADEQRMVRAHERAHIDRLDARFNALALALQCLNWFNPLAYAAVRAMHFDQELACDATVMMRLPGERKRYAEALLRSQTASIASPLGCDWLGAGCHPLVTRLTTLLQARPEDGERDVEAGAWWSWILLVATILVGVLAGAWAFLPAVRDHIGI